MDRLKINIRDTQFGKDQVCSTYGKISKHIEWCFEPIKVSEVCFFTDSCLTDVYKIKHVKRKVAWLIEPKAISPHCYEWIIDNNKLFDFVLTYDLDLVKRRENFLWCPHGMAWASPDNNTHKSNLISAVFSNKNFTQGHHIRHQIANTFKDKIDLYGRGYKPIENKNIALSSYKFSICVENSIQPGYWTEKIIDCFITKTIPIYWGSKNVLDHFCDDSIIVFDNLTELQSIILDIHLNKIKYEEHSKSIENNFETAKQFEIPEDWIYNNYKFLFQ